MLRHFAEKRANRSFGLIQGNIADYMTKSGGIVNTAAFTGTKICGREEL
jgi:hypothetical protein